MFERNRIDNTNQAQQVAVPAEIMLDTGDVSRGKFFISVTRTFADTLNSDTPFLEFEAYGEDRRFIAKSSIRSVKLVNVPSAGNLQNRLRDHDGFDPHNVLGVERKADWASIRATYVALSKNYHPDRYASTELPSEVHDYLAAMSRRINLAYASLEGRQQTAKAIAQRPEPVFTSGPRA